jgi:hypothetical protein
MTTPLPIYYSLKTHLTCVVRDVAHGYGTWEFISDTPNTFSHFLDFHRQTFVECIEYQHAWPGTTEGMVFPTPECSWSSRRDSAGSPHHSSGIKRSDGE